MSKAKCIMVQGTMSGAGKSLLCAALCRIFAQDGYRVAPFKSQNMALNSFVTRDGLEMGRAQVVQAQAAGIEPDVRMNPILLKPSSDVGSQVIVNGEVRGQMKASEYFRTKRQLVPDILKAYDSLAEEADVIVIEGAGSPAEINLKSEDIVNMGLAEMVDAPVLLVGDIDRGGVFAQLYGTGELLEEKERRRIKGLVINKFRGDVEILRPGLSMLEEKTHLPVVGVVPYLKVDIEDEDSLSQRLEMRGGKKPLDAAIIRLPHLSNFTDFMPMEQHPLLGVRYVSNAHELGAPDLILLPGTKNTVDDLLWLRQCGLETALLKLAAKGTPVLGVCGGYQLLGETLDDSQGTESGHPQTLRGLGLLPTRTVFTAEKRRAQVTATAAAPFAGAALTGYEIHTGRTAVNGAPFCRYADGTPEGCVQNAVFGTYLHGLFDSGELTEQLAAYLCRRKGIAPETAAGFASLFFVGITVGRALCGFLTLKFDDTQMVRMGQGIIAIGIAAFLLPLGEAVTLAGLLLVGLGCAPIYPSIIHATPGRFGADRSQAIIGVQMASAYIGNCLMPPLFGVIANHTTIAIFPYYLLVILILMGYMHEALQKKTKAAQ